MFNIHHDSQVKKVLNKFNIFRAVYIYIYIYTYIYLSQQHSPEEDSLQQQFSALAVKPAARAGKAIGMKKSTWKSHPKGVMGSQKASP